MTKNLSIFVLALLVSVFLIWEYKVHLIVWALPKVMNVVNPIQENIPTTWSMGPEEVLDRDDARPNIILILADDMGYNDVSYIMVEQQMAPFNPHIDSLQQAVFGLRRLCSKCYLCAFSSSNYDREVSN